MPKYTDPETGKVISSSTPLSDMELNEAFGIVQQEVKDTLPSTPPEEAKKNQAGFDFTLAAQNLGEGAWGKLKDLVNPQTYLGLIELTKTVGEANPAFPATSIIAYAKGGDPYEKLYRLGQSLANDMISKYGSWDKVKSTFQNTPIEPILDASMILTAGGTSLAGKTGWLGKLGKVTQTAGMATDPFNVAIGAPARILSWVGSPATRRLSNWMYRSSSKLAEIDKDLDLDTVKKIAQRGLDEGLWMSQSKLKELKFKMDALRKQINDNLDIAQKEGKFVDTWQAAEAIDEMKKIYGVRTIPIPELDSMLDDLKQIMMDAHGERITPKIAQQMKMNSQKFLDNAYGKLSVIAKEAEKYGTASVRKQLEEISPELKYLNPKMREYDLLKDAIEKQVRKSMDAPLVEGLSFWNAVARRTVDNPLIKSRVAVAINASRKKKFSPRTTIGREIVYQYDDFKSEGQVP